jgi:hypothetical protein
MEIIGVSELPAKLVGQQGSNRCFPGADHAHDYQDHEFSKDSSSHAIGIAEGRVSHPG